LSVCETELQWVGMVVNTKKSSCIRVGPGHKVTFNKITTRPIDNKVGMVQ